MTRSVRLPLTAALVLTISLPATAAGPETPEEAVRAYLEGVASADIDRVLETTAMDEMAEGYRFDRQTERLRAYTPFMPGPVHSPFFRDVQRAGWTGRLLRQTRMLAYSLLAADVLGEALGGGDVPNVDGAWAHDLVTALDEARLTSLVVIDVAVPAPGLQEDSFYVDHSARGASIHGADAQTERVALLDFEGDTYMVGFTLLRYGDDWKESQQSSALIGQSSIGTAQPMTIDQFTELTSE